MDDYITCSCAARCWCECACGAWDDTIALPCYDCGANVAGIIGMMITKKGTMMKKIKSDGSTAKYYELPPNSTQLQDLISFKNMNAQIGEIFRASYRYGEVEHSEKLRDAKKMRFYIDAEIERLENYENVG